VFPGPVALAATLCLAGLPSPAGAATPRIEAVGATPAPIAGARYAGALAPAAPLHLTVVLAPRDQAALTRFVDAVSTPGSPTYGEYLAPGEFGPRFGASAETIGAVDGALRTAGLEVGPASSNGLTIPVSGTASAVGAALHIGFARYTLPGGRNAFANTSQPRLAADVAGAVRDVVGLQTTTRPAALGLAEAASTQPSAAAGVTRRSADSAIEPSADAVSPDGLGPAPCAAASGEATVQGAYTLDAFAEGYGLDPFYADADSGAGTTVGIYELEPDLPSDIAAFETCFGANTAVEDIPIDGGAGTGAGSGEAAIDIEGVIGVAPQSRIEVFEGPDTGTGPLDVYVAMADDDTSQVNTTSWGLCEQDMLLGDPNAISDETPVFQQMVAQGQTLYAATGDDGSEGCTGDLGTHSNNSLAVNDPASQPTVTGVGGTSLVATYTAGGRPVAVDPTPLGMPPLQTAWNESALGAGAGGGGISTQHAMPGYQAGAPVGLNVLNANSSAAPCGAPAGGACREVPDVSATADPVGGGEIYCTDDGTPGTLCQEGNTAASKWEAVGGTSAAAPFWAGLTALINSDPGDGCAVPGTFGLINPLLYTIAAGPNHAGALTDITLPSAVGAPTDNDYRGLHGGLFPVGAGYDMATGLGTPLAGGPDGLAHQLCALRAPVTQSPTLSSVSPAGGPSAAGTAVTLDGVGFVPGATVTVGGSPATGVQVLSFNQIAAVLPAGNGAEQVTVTTPHGTSGPLTFTYAPAPPPSQSASPTPTTPATPTTPGGGGSPPAKTSPTAPAGKTATRSGASPATLVLTCTRTRLAITDVVEGPADVRVTGAAPTGLHGRKVRIFFGARHAEVGVATVAANGLFDTRVPLPPASVRAGRAARYEAKLGSLESAALPLTRRVVLDPPTETGGRITLTGRVVGPLAKPAALIVVRESTSCAAGTPVASIRPGASGRFTLKLAEPARARAALFRLGTRVRRTPRSSSATATASLLEPVGLS
jgi:Pro-kumamolisin, activation domain/IPT/TIG domain/Subtilase family